MAEKLVGRAEMWNLWVSKKGKPGEIIENLPENERKIVQTMTTNDFNHWIK